MHIFKAGSKTPFLISSLLLLCLSVTCEHLKGQEVYEKFDVLKERLEKGKDTTFIVNFWATWCKPCVEELPIFNELRENEDKNGNPLKVLLVSLDFRNDFEKKLLPFIKDRQIKKEVVLLADADMNSWIPGVNKSWDGNIPVTWMISDGKEKFINRSVANKKELDHLIADFTKR